MSNLLIFGIAFLYFRQLTNKIACYLRGVSVGDEFGFHKGGRRMAGISQGNPDHGRNFATEIGDTAGSSQAKSRELPGYEISGLGAESARDQRAGRA